MEKLATCVGDSLLFFKSIIAVCTQFVEIDLIVNLTSTHSFCDYADRYSMGEVSNPCRRFLTLLQTYRNRVHTIREYKSSKFKLTIIRLHPTQRSNSSNSTIQLIQPNQRSNEFKLKNSQWVFSNSIISSITSKLFQPWVSA